MLEAVLPSHLNPCNLYDFTPKNFGARGFHRIAYTEWGQASAAPPVICVHGLIRNGRDFDYLSRALERDGRQVFCPDIVGRGAFAIWARRVQGGGSCSGDAESDWFAACDQLAVPQDVEL